MPRRRPLRPAAALLPMAVAVCCGARAATAAPLRDVCSELAVYASVQAAVFAVVLQAVSRVMPEHTDPWTVADSVLSLPVLVALA
eukprot:gene23448-47840_t